MQELTLPAPAKINLFLHILGKRTDGYHNIQTVFQLTDFADTLVFKLRTDSEINLTIAGDVKLSTSNNLVLTAATLLQTTNQSKLGADIHLIKRIPIGAGLGGASSNAATTLIGLNQLWQLGNSLSDLSSLAVQIGADVPVFVLGCSAWGQGIGEQLTPVKLPRQWYLIVTPDCQLSTKAVFSHSALTRNTSPIKMSDFLSGGVKTHNDCQAVACQIEPEIEQVLNWLNKFGSARMTGTGSSFFISCESKNKAETIFAKLPQSMNGIVTQGLNISLVHELLDL